MLKPPHPKGGGYKECRLPLLLRTHMEWITGFLALYINEDSKYGKGSHETRWTASSLHVAASTQGSSDRVLKIHRWAKAFILNREALPISQSGKSCTSRIDNEDVAADIAAHLQSIGVYVTAQDLVNYVSIPAVKTRLGIKKSISHETAGWWMKKMRYCWTKKPSGQYVDGHEHQDVVYYHQTIFLPAWAELDRRTQKWSEENAEIINKALANDWTVIIWFHDESTFYTNNR